MIKKLLKITLRWLAMEKGLYKSLYIRICQPSSLEYADYLRRHGRFFHIGRDSSINVGANITDPAYVYIGNNCTLSDCTLLGHDGVIRILNNAYGKKLDSVGKIKILDNCFIGYQSVIMPGVTIGPNSIVGAGSVVTKNVPSGEIFGGVPAKKIGVIDDLVAKLERTTALYPWNDLIQQRDNAFDPKLEPELVKRRVEYFFGKSK